ncbi:MAG: ribonuclease HI family protein [Syntrophorhabdus sp.]
MAFFDQIHLYTDGGSKGNPGPGSIGVVIYDVNNNLLYEFSECIGHCTNNQSEYRALIKGLDICARYTRKRITVFSDSELVVKHMNGVYRLKNDDLRSLFQEVKDRERVFETVVYQHVKRTSNQRIKRADELLNQAHAGRPCNKCIVNP